MKENKIDKNEIIFLFMFGIFAVILAIVLRKDISKYAETGKVANVEKTENGYMVEFITSNGNVYMFEAEDGDIYTGELYSLLMDSNYTNDTVKDDKILEIKYCNY